MAHEQEKEIVILYHGGCPDGIGGAYAAWKKFGNAAEYIPAKHGKPVPDGLESRKIFFIDFSYPRRQMDEIVKLASSVTVLDHHLGTREVVESVPDHVFDEKSSGATIAWRYFHPDTAIPLLLQYVEDGDLYKFTLPYSRQVLAYVYTSPLLHSYEDWDALSQEIENKKEFERVVQTGSYFEQYHDHVVENGVHHAELVRFEGYDCLLSGTTGEFISDVGNKLAIMKAPIAMVVSANASETRVSLRSDGSVDVASLAQKYGGNGHPAAAGFRIEYGKKVPWEVIEDDENTRN